MAEAVLKHVVKEQGLAAHFGKIDSCGTGGYHVGDEADYRWVHLSGLAPSEARVHCTADC